MARYSVVEVCAGAGGQSLGLHKAGFDHAIAIEIDETAAETLRTNGGWRVEVGDVADPAVWRPEEFEGVSLFAGGVPCPPFSVAGKQLGSSDERDLFAWAIEQVAVLRPRAVMLENVRGLSGPRFSAYRQRVLDRLSDLGYVGGWRLLQASDFGVPQLRHRVSRGDSLPTQALASPVAHHSVSSGIKLSLRQCRPVRSHGSIPASARTTAS
ncbi:hypothetical protein GCM10017576_28130 [Microbacterium barkeri]|uniref:Cytosine-specific methyltransferase n=2 Tax=Microbacterium barkeri TaxID=33917 RepID=A0A9W6LXQ0_9MICO|nr:hypothetical protein GCM10017576_28130 [Microbacterium barkeri]